MKRNFPKPAGEEKVVRAPSMSRSRGQLASAYAPGVIFTFEGGLGASLSVSDQSDGVKPSDVDDETKQQIHLRLREIWRNWFARAMSSGTEKAPPLAEQCLDGALVYHGAYKDPRIDTFELVDPVSVNYIPAPLAFVCNTCKRFKDFETVKTAADGMHGLSSDSCDTREADKKGQCRWRQLDVIFVHWSGRWIAPTPGRYEWNLQKHELQKPIRGCQQCNRTKFYLRDESPRIGQWVFECEQGHRDHDTWLQNDPDTTEILEDECSVRPPRWRRMEPISYRASAAFYAQSEQFVVFPPEQRELLKLLREGNGNALAAFISERFGLGAKVPSVDEILDVLMQSGHSAKVNQYKFIRDVVLENARRTKDHTMVEASEGQLQSLMKDWMDTPGLIPVTHEVPPELEAQIARRADFGSRYDPIVLAVEHEALKRSKLRAPPGVEGRAQFVRFTSLDRDLAPKEEGQRRDQEATTQRLQDLLGIAEMGLIREFELCRFTHGFTRMSADPTIEKQDGGSVTYPVRLNLFPAMRSRNNCRPIYVITQGNEAIYVRLKPEVVYEWLKDLNVSDLPDWRLGDDVDLGAHVLRLASPFGKFFSDLTPGDPQTYRYVYTLLHSYAHALMKGVAEFSGLDMGSLGEYLFPADFAFVVYRNGTTMDLGNLSALWRNYNNTFLEHFLHDPTLLCGSGSLCDANGGACPDCIMVPETSCVASNRLLSRSVLRTGEAPPEDALNRGKRIPGYFDTVRRLANA
jgi:hypothetical protein